MPVYRRRDALAGINRVSVGAGGRLFATFKAGGVNFAVGGTRGFAGSTRGVIADASISYPFIASPRIIMIPSLGTSWADRKHNDRYFGVSAREAAESGLPRYRLGGGLKDVTASLTTSYRLSRRMDVVATTSIATLVADVKDSPIVQRKFQRSGFLALSYLIGR